MSAIRVVIADPSTLVRRLLAQGLSGETDISVIGEASTGYQAVELTSELQPDVLITELELPDMSGAVVAQRVRTQYPQIAVVLMGSDDELAVTGRLSDSIFGNKRSISPAEVVAHVRQAARRTNNRPN